MAATKGSVKSKKTPAKKLTKKGDKKVAKKSVKSAKTSAKTNSKSTRKLPSFFSFANRKFVILLIVFVAAAGFGTWKLYSTQAAGGGKYPPVVACYKWKPLLKEGMTVKNSGQTCIWTLQVFLNDRGQGIIAVDGKFGPQTREAVKRYQRTRGITADGIVGGQTWGAMRDHCYATQHGDTNFHNVCYIEQ